MAYHILRITKEGKIEYLNQICWCEGRAMGNESIWTDIETSARNYAFYEMDVKKDFRNQGIECRFEKVN